MSNLQASDSTHTYVRFWELHDIDLLTSDEGSDYFEFMPSKAKLNLRRGDGTDEWLPSKDDIEEGMGAGELYVSGQEDYRKYFSSRVVSHDHCSIRWKPTQRHPRLTDLGSTHGTFLMRLGSNVPWYELNKEMKKAKLIEVKESEILQDGDVIQLGKSVTRSKEQHQPAYLLVEMCQSVGLTGPAIAAPDVKSAASVAVDKPEKKDVEVNIISSDEEEITLDRGKNGVEPLDLDESEIGSTCNSESVDFDAADGEEEEVPTNKDDRSVPQDLMEYDVELVDEEEEEEEEIAKSVASDLEELEEESDGESSVASDADEEEESNEELNEDMEDLQDKEAIVLPSSSFHHDYEALIRADESYRENLKMQAVEATQKMAEELLLATTTSIDEVIVEGNSTSEVSGLMQVDVDSSQDETLGSVDSSSPIIDKDSDCSTDATSEAEEVLEVKDVTIQEKTTAMMVEESQEQLPQVAGKKRSHDEIEEEVISDGTALIASEPASTSTQASLPASESPSFKKLKTFTVGLAAGILAGAVGTFMGLNSLVLDDSSFL